MVYVGMVPPGGPSGQMKARRQHIPFHGMTHPCRRICRPHPIMRRARTVGHERLPGSHPMRRSSRLIYPRSHPMRQSPGSDLPQREIHAASARARSTAANTSRGRRSCPDHRKGHLMWRQRSHVYRSNHFMRWGRRPSHHGGHLLRHPLVPESPQESSCVATPRHISVLCGIFLPHILFVRHFSSSMPTLPACEITNRQVDDVPFFGSTATLQKTTARNRSAVENYRTK